MGRLLLVGRLAARDLRRRPFEAALLLLAITAATTTLTLGLVLRDSASDPYLRTRDATDGPDVVASIGPHPREWSDDPGELVFDQPAELAGLEALASDPGVVDHSGPYPVTAAELQASGRTSDVQAVGRDAAPAPVDQPEVIEGSWVSDGGVVVEAAFANALDVAVGDPVTLDGRSFLVVGLAVTAAMPLYPEALCFLPCVVGAVGSLPDELAAAAERDELVQNPGLIWLTEADVRSLTPDPDLLSYVMNLKLAEPDEAQAFVEASSPSSPAAPGLESWDAILARSTELAGNAQIVLVSGAWLLGLLAVASVSVLVGGRMADQTRRVGLLKAVGGTPGLVATVLLAEYVVVAIAASAAGLAIGSLAAPLLTESSAGLIGSAGTPATTVSTAGLVTAVALGVAVAATAVPAVRAASTSTVRALADSARPSRRTGWLIAISAGLPVPLLLALRIAARRPRRAVLAVVSIAISVSGAVVALSANAELTRQRLAGWYADGQADVLGDVLLVVVAMVLSLAAVNAVFITWATVLDNRHSSALARALGATPRQVSSALAAAQVLPAVAGAVLGVFPGSVLLFATINAINDSDNDATAPPLWQLLTVVLATVVVVAALTAVPAHLGARRPAAPSLRAERA